MDFDEIYDNYDNLTKKEDEIIEKCCDNVNNYNHLARVINKSINTITDYIKNEYEMIENNKKLTIWTTVLGDFNNHGLRAHAPIRVKEKKTQSMAFNMNY